MSKELKHIPRDWRIEDHGYSISIEPNICVINSKTAETREKMVALANFIAAAPEMYKTLEWLYKQFDDSTDEEAALIAWEIIEPVLKKARGEE